MAGRPTKYLPEFCEQLITHMGKGLSYDSFAGAIGVGRQTLYDWEKVNPEFAEAKKIGDAKSLLFWESVNVDYVIEQPQGKKVNTGLFAIAVKNRFPDLYRDRREEPPRGASPLSPETAAAVDEIIKEDLARREKSA